MKLFGFGTEPTPVDQATDVLSKAQEKHARLQAQHVAAGEELAELKTQAQHAAEGFGTGLDDLSHEIAAAEAKVAALTAAVDTAQRAVADAGRQLAEARDSQARSESIAKINNIIGDVDGPLQAMLVQLTALISALRPAADITLDCKSLLGFLELAAVELPTSGKAAIGALRYQAKAIELRSAPALRPRTEPVPKVAINNVPATKTIVLLYPGRWIDVRSGLMRHAGRGWDCELEASAAARCVERGVALHEHDEGAMRLRRERGAPVAEVDAVDLDSESVAPPPKPKELWLSPSPPPRWSDQPAVNTWMRPNRPMPSGEGY